MKIDWVKKLTSRKLWMSVSSFVSMLVVAIGYTESEGAEIAALIMAGASVVAYIVGEGLADAGNSGELIEIEGDVEEVEG